MGDRLQGCAREENPNHRSTNGSQNVEDLFHPQNDGSHQQGDCSHDTYRRICSCFVLWVCGRLYRQKHKHRNLSAGNVADYCSTVCSISNSGVMAKKKQSPPPKEYTPQEEKELQEFLDDLQAGRLEEQEIIQTEIFKDTTHPS
jgi:hypothetical protein